MNQKAMLRALKKLHSAEEADEPFDAVNIKMREIESEREKYAHKALEQHFGENILPILALYLALKGRDELVNDALTLAQNTTEEMYKIGRKRMAFLGRFPFFYSLIQKMTSNMMKKMFPSEGWDIEWLDVNKKQVAFNMQACFYLDSLTKYGAPELTPVFLRVG